jgi:hypothetical protein
MIRNSKFSSKSISTILLGASVSAFLPMAASADNLQALREGLTFRASCTIVTVPRFYTTGLGVDQCEVTESLDKRLKVEDVKLPESFGVWGTSLRGTNDDVYYGPLGARVDLVLRTKEQEVPVDQYNTTTQIVLEILRR